MKIKSVPFELLFPPNMNYEYFENAEELPVPASETDTTTLEEAWWAAEASLLSYEHPGFARLVLRLLGSSFFRSFSWGVTQALAFSVRQTCIVAFRGTEIKSTHALKDMSANLGYGVVPFASGLAYRGFVSAFSEVLESDDNIFRFIAAARKDHGCQRVVFCGHSLGGALASLAAVYYGNPCHLYTFGAPRVGDERFVRLLPSTSLRFVNAGDPVPSLPPNIRAIMRESTTLVHGDLPTIVFGGDGLVEPSSVTEQEQRASKAIMRGVQRVGGGLVSSLSTLKKSRGSGEESSSSTFLADLASNTTMDAHAPVKYAVNIWNHIAGHRNGT
ncbi:MAG: lipase family protein [Alkalispirochaeta sp.]